MGSDRASAALLRYIELLEELPAYQGDSPNEQLTFLGIPLGFVEMRKADLSDAGITDAATSELQRLAKVLSSEENGIATRFFTDIEWMIGMETADNDSAGAEQRDTE